MANEVTNEVYIFEKSASGLEVFRIDCIKKELVTIGGREGRNTARAQSPLLPYLVPFLLGYNEDVAQVEKKFISTTTTYN